MGLNLCIQLEVKSKSHDGYIYIFSSWQPSPFQPSVSYASITKQLKMSYLFKIDINHILNTNPKFILMAKLACMKDIPADCH